jgi:hypothetical protein
MKMTKDLLKKYTNLIVLLQSFESLWNFYSVSEGELYGKEVKESTNKLVDYFDEVYKFDPNLFNLKAITLNSKNSEEYVRERLKGLKYWANSQELFPFSQPGMGANETSRFALQGFLMCEKVDLCKKLNLDVFKYLM